MEAIKVELGDEVLQWFRWGDRDYVAARQLLIAGLLVQGISLATTSIEKYLKARFTLLNLPFPKSHNPAALYLQIKGKSQVSLDEQFLKLISKAYRLRYPDDLPNGFNIALNQVLLLTKLDHTVFSFTDGLRLFNSRGNLPLVFEQAMKTNDRRVLDGNAALDAGMEANLRSKPSRSLDFHKLANGAVLEAEYTTLCLDQNASIDATGMAQLSDRQFTLAYGPVAQEGAI